MMSEKNDKKIKFCALTTISKTMEWFILDSARNLEKNGYEITLVCDMDEDFQEKQSDFTKCYPLSMKRGASIGDLFRCTFQLWKIFRREKFDVIYYMSPNVSFYASIAGFLAGVKHRVYSQTGLRYVSLLGIKRAIFKLVEQMTCLFSTHIRAQSPLNRQYVIDERLCVQTKIRVLGLGGTTGVDLSLCDSFNACEMCGQLRTKYGVPTDGFVYGYLGRINNDKGINELVAAFRNIQEVNPNIWLVLVGMLDDANPITSENMEYINNHCRIVHTGNVPSGLVYQHMAMFDVLVHPTYREGFGKVLQEAMGMRLPIITTDVVGPKEVVEADVSGLLVEVQNVQALEGKMNQIYCDDDLRKRLSKAGRIRAERYFDRPIMLQNILDDLNQIVTKR